MSNQTAYTPDSVNQSTFSQGDRWGRYKYGGLRGLRLKYGGRVTGARYKYGGRNPKDSHATFTGQTGNQSSYTGQTANQTSWT